MTTARRIGAVLLLSGLLLPAEALAQVKNWPSESVPGPLKAPPVPFPPYEVRTLANGLQMVVVEQHEQPAVSVRMLVGAGSAQDPGDRPGIANLVASLLDQGTAAHTARQLADAVDAIGGQVAIGAGTDSTFAYITVLRDDLDTGFELLSEIVRTPALAEEEIERQRQQVRSALKVSYQDPAYLATAAFERLVYGLHPYGSPASGSPESIERITRHDLVAFHERYYVPNNCILAVVGDVVPAEAFAAAERAFGSWARREVTRALAFEPPAPARRILIINKPDAVQTEIRVGHLGLRRAARDYEDLDLAVRILGGEGANRLQQVLRVQRGLTYGASADLDAYRLSGDIVAATDTRTETTAEVLRVMVEEFFRLQRDDVSGQELADAKAYLAGSFPLTIETPDAISTNVLTALFYGLPLKDLPAFPDRVNGVTADDIQRVTRAYFRPDRLSVVLVGAAVGFVEQLRRVGFRDYEVIGLEDLDLAEADLRRPAGARAGPGAARPVEARRPDWDAAKPIVLKAVAACGGFETLQRVKTVQMKADTAVTTPGGPMKAATTTYIEYPSRVRVDATLPQGAISQASVDGAAWLKDVNGARDAPAAVRAELVVSLRRDWLALLRAAAGEKLMARRLVDGRGLADWPVNVVELWGEGLPPVSVSIDADTGRLVSLSYESPGPDGADCTVESFGDFRAVAGLQVPFTTVVRRGSVVLFERTLTDVQVNVPLAAALFQKPQ